MGIMEVGRSILTKATGVVEEIIFMQVYLDTTNDNQVTVELTVEVDNRVQVLTINHDNRDDYEVVPF